MDQGYLIHATYILFLVIVVIIIYVIILYNDPLLYLEVILCAITKTLKEAIASKVDVSKLVN